ncbi:hypothetical protein E8E13_003824 [Curvularia kusanoi]|uniref:Uncharacterized protein n=1 Tax=Curvularia kusanoi TaxID=90978 RepID=A0A9P4WDZ0_CURKU|nr:hypothetical protein E8E13_003824 [Curvularia kusanoi]
MMLSSAGLLPLFLLPAVCRSLPSFLSPRNATTSVDVYSALHPVKHDPIYNYALPLLENPGTATPSDPDLSAAASLQKQWLQAKSLTRRDSLLDTETTTPGANAVFATGEGEYDAFWQKHVCRGEKLTQASVRNKDTAIYFVSGIDSQFDGTMAAELQLWGYEDYSSNGWSYFCRLENIAADLNRIGIDTRFKRWDMNGQNVCFHVEHGRYYQSMPLEAQTYEVDSKTYRMTGAYSHIGVNARDGVISFFNVMSAERGAAHYWGVDQPSVEELPKLRQISDLAWGFWKRAHPDGAGLNNINKFLVHDIINPDTLDLMRLALQSYEVPEGQRYTYIPAWPGIEFDMETPEGKSMLGSPNGLAAGYFLVQHKTQLGANKYVYKVTIWTDNVGSEQMLFWVKNAPLSPEEECDRDGSCTPTPPGFAAADTLNMTAQLAESSSDMTGQIVEQSLDGKNVIREHRILARL